jgi:ribokinase
MVDMVARTDVVVVGSANLDVVATTLRLPRPGETVTADGYFEACGGKGANQVIAAARAGAHTTFVGAVGDDDAARQLRAAFVADGVDVSHLVTVGAPTGRALIGVSHDGENLIMVVPGANHVLSVDDVDAAADVIAGARVLLMQCEVPLEVIERAVARAGDDTIVVLNPAPARDLPAHLLAQLDVIVPNEHEVTLLGGTAALLDAGVGAVVVTEGARGARLVTRDGETRIAPHPVTPVDTTGAGDAFCGALAARLAAGDSLAVALRAAVVGGALSTLTRGAVPSLPTWAAIARHLSPTP